MTQRLTLILFTISSLTFAQTTTQTEALVSQTPEGLDKRLRLLTQPSAFTYDTAGFFRLPKLEYGCTASDDTVTPKSGTEVEK